MASLSIYDELLHTAVEAARRAGEEAVRRWEAGFQTRSKGRRDVVTDADLAAEEIIVELITQRYPDHAILAEEGGVVVAGAEPVFRWFIDPVDGTTNFSRHLASFAVSVGVAEAGRPVAGAVYDPVRGTMYSGRRGGGAYRDDARIVCSRRDDMEDALVQVEWPRSDDIRDHMRTIVDRLALSAGGMRTFGCATLALCNVAAGGADGYVNLSLGPWDIAAGGLLIEEAGGRVTGIDGNQVWAGGQTCLATNGHLHEALLRLIAPPAGERTR
mgnify:CR=1 FL=1